MLKYAPEREGFVLKEAALCGCSKLPRKNLNFMNVKRRKLSSGMLHHVALARNDVPQKCQFLQEPHGITSQKTVFFIITTVKTSNLTLMSVKDVVLDFVPCSTNLNRHFGECMISIFRVP
jgi:hypothetical protein